MRAARPRSKPRAKDAKAAKGAAGLGLEDGVLSGAIAKWLIPSVTALFATVGYLVQFAHEQLLGVAGDHAAGAYVAAAADFFRALPTILYESLVASSKDSWRLSHPWLMALAIGLAVCGMVLPRLPKKLAPRLVTPPWLETVCGWAPLVTLILIVMMKFVVLDAPLGAIKGLLLGEGLTGVSAKYAGADNRGKVPTLPEQAKRGFAVRFSLLDNGPASPRVVALKKAVTCSRVDVSLVSPTLGLKAKQDCPGSQTAYSDQLRTEFITHLWMYAMIVASALGVLAAPRGAVSAGLGILALAYGLTLANAYGKLEKSTEFDYGVLRLSDTFRNAAPKPTEPSLAPTDPGRLEALILSRGPSGMELLAVVAGSCGDNSGKRFARVKHTWIGASQVLSIQEIYRQDAITWTALNKVECPVSAAPIKMFRP